MPTSTILVEDSKTIRETLIPTLAELADVEVIAIAETAADADLALQQHAGWRLVVIDIFLKSGTGLEVLRFCHDRRPDQFAVVLSNYATDDMRERCRALGADAVFDKSTEIEAFLDYCVSIGQR